MARSALAISCSLNWGSGDWASGSGGERSNAAAASATATSAIAVEMITGMREGRGVEVPCGGQGAGAGGMPP